MKTLRYRIGNAVKPGILDNNGNVRDVSSLVKDWDNENVIIDKLNEVKKKFDIINKIFPGDVGLIHGALKIEEKDEILLAFCRYKPPRPSMPKKIAFLNIS